MVLFGNPKVGKSYLILGVAEAVADPDIEEYLGLPIEHHGPVLYIQLDTPRSLWTTGYISVIRSQQVEDGIYVIDREMEDLPKQFDIREPHCMRWLQREVERVKPVLVIVDTIRRMHRGNENESDTMAVVHDSFTTACYPAALVYLAHKKKAQAGETGNGTVRGSSGFTGAVDALVNMSKTKLSIEARSDIDEELPIYQLDNGSWSVNSEEEKMKEFIGKIGSGVAKTKQDELIAKEFGVSLRTARRLRTNMTKVGRREDD